MFQEYPAIAKEPTEGNFVLVAETGVIGLTFPESEEATTNKAESTKDEVK